MHRKQVFWARTALLSCAAFALFAVPSSAVAQSEPRRGIDKKADEAFSRMSSHLAAAKQLSAQCRIMTDHVLDTGWRVQLSRVTDLVLRRPDHLVATTVGDAENRAIWYQAAKLTLLDRNENTYAEVTVPQTIDEMFDHMAASYGFVVPLCDLLFSDPYKAALANVWAGVYVGLHDVAGVKCHHLLFRQDGVDWQIWIQDGDQPLPRKVVITYNNLPGVPQFIAFMDKWNLSDSQPAGVFEAKLPPDAKRTELRRMDQPSAAAPPPGASDPVK